MDIPNLFFSAKLFYSQPFNTTVMTKHLTLISIAAAVTIAVVLCTAGCISPADEIVGNWLEKTDGAVTYAVFAEDGTGFFAADEDSILTLEWKANGDKTYTFIFADGTTKTASVNAEHGLMTMGDGSVLEKQPNALSGKMVGWKEDPTPTPEPTPNPSNLPPRRGLTHLNPPQPPSPQPYNDRVS